MTGPPPAPPVGAPADGARVRRSRVLSALAVALMVAGVVLAAIRPPWLVEPLQAVVTDAGVWAPLVFVVVNVLLAPLHLNGVVIVLSAVIWPLPVAWGLSFAGSLAGCLLTAVALRLAGTASGRSREGWPGWLERLAGQVGRRPYLIGVLARVVLHSGIALEAFYLLTGYTPRRYLVTTVVGVAVWVTQALAGVWLLTALSSISPWLGLLAIALPLATLGVVPVVRRRRATARHRG